MQRWITRTAFWAAVVLIPCAIGLVIAGPRANLFSATSLQSLRGRYPGGQVTVANSQLGDELAILRASGIFCPTGATRSSVSSIPASCATTTSIREDPRFTHQMALGAERSAFSTRVRSRLAVPEHKKNLRQRHRSGRCCRHPHGNSESESLHWDRFRLD